MGQIADGTQSAAPGTEFPLHNMSFLQEADVRGQLNQGLQHLVRMPGQGGHVVRQDNKGHAGVKQLCTVGLSSSQQ